MYEDELIDGLTFRLQKFFHMKITKARLKVVRKDLIDHLCQETALAVLEKLKIEKYESFNISALIILKAGDVWSEYVSSTKAKPPNEPMEYLENIPVNRESVLRFENADLLNNYHQKSNDLSWKMLVMHTEGYNYKEIANYFNTTEPSVKMRISRLKNNLKS
jgi:DNA-directed RNA polymerase specialized sigma24 family protein